MSLIEAEVNLIKQISPSSNWDGLECSEYIIVVNMDFNKSDLPNFCPCQIRRNRMGPGIYHAPI